HQIASRPEVLANFNQEAKIIAQLKHPNIVNVLEMIDAYSTRFIIMEKVDGINLRQYLKKYGVFQPAQTCKIIKELAKALEYAHKLGEKGIIHRDIKPANVIMDPQGNIKLMDFGIAGPAGTADTVVGTPAYMAPEIIKRKTTDGRSDIYALGILAYEMMTGKPPFIGNNFTQTLSMHLNNPPPKLQAGNSELCQGLAHFIGRALVKNPAQRIDNWTEIQQLLRPDATANSAEQSLNSYNDFGIFIRVHEPTKDNINKLKIDIENALSPSQISHSIQPLIPNSLSLEEMKKIDDQADSIASAMTMIDL
ncbi:MAG: serine/threonine protein kinase, partial [Methylococcales bacterium]|nr:serine/threonine protein kinase [Methylococcales bacterium]